MEGGMTTGDDWRADRIGAALRGENPNVLRRLNRSFAVMGDPQFLPGYCVLLADDPQITRLSDLARQARLLYLADLDRLAEAVEIACRGLDPAFRRVNIEILGNRDAFLHAHVWPRYDWEPPELVGRPVWHYPQECWSDAGSALGPQHDRLRADLVDALDALTTAADTPA
jgi:diadenosine tetraphosphate (Ap4A) HIT family hydrolase